MRFSVFAVPKAMRGHAAVIQTNAINSWIRLPTCPELILVGDDPGVADLAASVRAKHIPTMERNEWGTPILSDVIANAERAASAAWMCYVNADIILTPSFAHAVLAALRALPSCMVISRRWNLRIDEHLDFADHWAARLQAKALTTGDLFTPWGIDVFVYPKGALGPIPPFALGRSYWDNWLVWRARELRLPVVDATGDGTVIHQDHSYAGFSSLQAIRRSAQGLRNFALAGDHTFTLANVDDATHRVVDGQLHPVPTPSVSVVIPHAGTTWQLHRCLHALSVQTYPRSYLQIVVVNSSLPEGLDWIAQSFPFVKITSEDIGGPAAARNKGAALADGDVIAFLDSDCVPHSDWIAHGIKLAKETHMRSVVACNVVPGATSPPLSAAAAYETVVYHEHEEYIHHAQARATGAMIVPRHVWRAVGPFDEDFPEAAGEDWEWSTRATGLGVSIAFAPQSRVTHPVHHTTQQLKAKARRLSRGEVQLARKTSDDRMLSIVSATRLYARRLLHELRSIASDRRLSPFRRLLAASAAVRVFLWTVPETYRSLVSASSTQRADPQSRTT